MKTTASHLIGLAVLRARVAEYAHRIGIPALAIYGTPQGDGSPYIEVRDAYYFVVEERGLELERRKTDDVDELLYWIFDAATLITAYSFEVRNRRSNEDRRRQLFAKQEELLRLASDAWARRKESEHRTVLAKYPFSDPSS